MPTAKQKAVPSSAMSFNLTTKYPQNASHIPGLFQTRELTIVRHIEELKCAANAPLLFPNLNNSSKPTASLLSIENSGEHTDINPLKIRPNSTNWVVDPSLVPGNLRKPTAPSSELTENVLTIEDIISRGSSVSERSAENETDNQGVKSHVRARRKANKSLKRRAEAKTAVISSGVSLSSSFNPHSKSNKSHHQPSSKSIDSNSLDTLTALCKSITIQRKVPNNVSAKPSPYERKSPNSQANALKPTVSKAGGSHAVKKVSGASSEKALLSRGRASTKVGDDVKTVKVFQSDQQSGIISDLGLAVPCAPPATPTPEQLRKFEYIPSLQDVRAQRAFRQRLLAMETKASMKELRKQENQAAADKLTVKERKQHVKKIQRQQIYALNKVMTDLEYSRFQNFMHGVGSGKV